MTDTLPPEAVEALDELERQAALYERLAQFGSPGCFDCAAAAAKAKRLRSAAARFQEQAAALERVRALPKHSMTELMIGSGMADHAYVRVSDLDAALAGAVGGSHAVD